jgi:hypothetical protein
MIKKRKSRPTLVVLKLAMFVGMIWAGFCYAGGTLPIVANTANTTEDVPFAHDIDTWGDRWKDMRRSQDIEDRRPVPVPAYDEAHLDPQGFAYAPPSIYPEPPPPRYRRW